MAVAPNIPMIAKESFAITKGISQGVLAVGGFKIEEMTFMWDGLPHVAMTPSTAIKFVSWDYT